MGYEERYKRNFESLSLDEQEILSKKKVCVIGCGGLGGYVIETLARIGVLYITAVDGDIFEESNLNRQLFCCEKNIDVHKAAEAKKRICEINSSVYINALTQRLTDRNAQSILKGHDVVVDALDNVETRFVLRDNCRRLNIPLIHGAIAGWYGQVSTILPDDATFDILYKNQNEAKNPLGNLPFTAAFVASIQACEAVKVLLGRGGLLTGGFLTLDLLNNDIEFIE